MVNIFNSIKNNYLVRLIFFWLLLFLFYRFLFISYHNSRIPDGKFIEASFGFLYALRLDLSTACAATAIPFLLWAIHQFSNSKVIYTANILFNTLCISIVTLFSIANIKIYEEWGTPLSARAFHYLLYPQEILSYMSFSDIILSFSFIGVMIYVGVKSYKKYVVDFSSPLGSTSLKVLSVILIPFLLVIGYRGGLQLAPINESAAYYSTTQINNHIATNSMWYLAHSFVDANDTKNPYLFMDIAKAQEKTDALFEVATLNSQSIVKSKNPNIVIIVLESWTSDIIEELGGEKNVTPRFKELRKEGLLLSQMYSSGFRTEQGLTSVLSGFPSQPNNSIITTPSKAEKLPSLTSELNKRAYQSSFYYGGEIEFANMKSYLLNVGFETIVDKNSFAKDQLNSKWGAHDEFVLKKQMNGLMKAKAPFFSIVLTLSTHEPFEVTMQTPFNGSEEAEKFKKAAYYTDHCLFNYFEEAKKQPWYNNTLFVLVADHGHRLPKHRNMNYPEGRRITAMLTGGALIDSLRGKTFDKICNQHDIASTILNQLNIPYKSFNWSKDIFNANYKEFAYYSNDNSVGWITPQQNIVYSFNSKTEPALQAKTQTTLNDSLVTDAKAYLQTLYEQYLNY